MFGKQDGIRVWLARARARESVGGLVLRGFGLCGSCVCLVCPAPPGVFEPVSPPTVTTWSPKWQGAKEGKPGYTLHEGYASSSHRRAWPCTQHDLGGAVRRGLDFLSFVVSPYTNGEG